MLFVLTLIYGPRHVMRASQVSMTIFPGDTALLNFKSSKEFPVAKYRSVTESRSLGEIGSRIIVFCFSIKGVTIASSSSKEFPFILRKFLKSSGSFWRNSTNNDWFPNFRPRSKNHCLAHNLRVLRFLRLEAITNAIAIDGSIPPNGQSRNDAFLLNTTVQLY